MLKAYLERFHLVLTCAQKAINITEGSTWTLSPVCRVLHQRDQSLLYVVPIFYLKPSSITMPWAWLNFLLSAISGSKVASSSDQGSITTSFEATFGMSPLLYRFLPSSECSQKSQASQTNKREDTHYVSRMLVNNKSPLFFAWLSTPQNVISSFSWGWHRQTHPRAN